MIGCNVGGYKRACAPVIGGTSNLYVGDANDFDFTKGEQVAGEEVGYEAIAYKTFGTGGAATATLASDAVGTVAVGTPGIGYTIAPTITFTGGGGTGAVGTATVVNGVITAITVSSGGTGYTTAPTVVITPAGASAGGGAYLYEIDSLEDSILFEATQSYADGASEWAYDIKAKAAVLGQKLTNFTTKMDAAAACCQLVFVAVQNDGRILVAGEKYVDGLPIAKWRIRQDGTKLSGGQTFKSFNGGELNFKGTYLRGPWEFTGGLSALTPFISA